MSRGGLRDPLLANAVAADSGGAVDPWDAGSRMNMRELPDDPLEAATVNIEKIQANIRQLKKLGADLGGRNDTQALRDRLQEGRRVTNVLCKVPLFTFELHGPMLQWWSVESEPVQIRCQKYAELIRSLPTACRLTVLRLFPLLRAVADLGAVNMMTTQNLGIVFGPTLLRSQQEAEGSVDISGRSANTVDFVVAHWTAIAQFVANPNAVPTARDSLSPSPSPAVTRPASTSPVAHPPVSAPPGLAMHLPPPSLQVPTKMAAAAPPSLPAPSLGGPPPSLLPPGSSMPAKTPATPVAAKAPPAKAGSVSPAVTAARSSGAGVRTAIALYNFTGDAAKGQINLVKDMEVVVQVERPGGWCTVECGGAEGYVPHNYLKF